MTREIGECRTFTHSDEGKEEPEEEDFFLEVVQNSLQKNRKFSEKVNKKEKKRG